MQYNINSELAAKCIDRVWQSKGAYHIVVHFYGPSSALRRQWAERRIILGQSNPLVSYAPHRGGGTQNGDPLAHNPPPDMIMYYLTSMDNVRSTWVRYERSVGGSNLKTNLLNQTALAIADLQSVLNMWPVSHVDIVDTAEGNNGRYIAKQRFAASS